MPEYAPHTERMLRAIAEQIAGKPIPEGGKRVLDGFTVDQLHQVERFVIGFDPHHLTDMGDRMADYVNMVAELEAAARELIASGETFLCATHEGFFNTMWPDDHDMNRRGATREDYREALEDVYDRLTEDRWYKFTAWNEETRYGWGSATEAERMRLLFNHKREHPFFAEPVEDDETLEWLARAGDDAGFNILDELNHRASEEG